jgi:hypothetical protein
MNILNEERVKYQTIWQHPEYRITCHSMDLWNNHREFFPEKISSALDIACGLGFLFSEWNNQGIDAWAVDLVNNCLDEEVRMKWGYKFRIMSLWEMNWERHFQFGICTDVMEHIPTNFVFGTLEKIANSCEEILFKIAHFQGSDLGGPRLHLTLHPVDWWIHQMEFISGHAIKIPYQHRPGLPDSIIRWRP